MKKALAVFVALLLICGTCFAEGLDYASMTDAQLHDIVNAARNELTKRELIAAQNTVLCEQDGVQVYLNGKYQLWKSDENVFIELGVIVINDSDKSISINIKECSINGWTTFAMGVSETPAGKKQKGTITIRISDADISTFEEIDDLEIAFQLYNMSEWKIVSNTDVVTVSFNK